MREILLKKQKQKKQKTWLWNEDPHKIKNLYFAACPQLETLCIHGLDFCGTAGKLMTRDSDVSIRKLSLLPEHFTARRFAHKDKEGRFLFGVPNAIEEHHHDHADVVEWFIKQHSQAKGDEQIRQANNDKQMEEANENKEVETASGENLMD